MTFSRSRGGESRTVRWFAALPASRIKVALFIGFALICVTWLFAGYYFTRRMSDLQTRATSINERYMRGQELLTVVRSQVLVGSVYVRDALLDPDRTAADEYRSKLEQAYRAADQALQEYVPVADAPSERSRIAGLRAGIDDFRTTVLNVLATDNTRWPIEARTLLRLDVMPKRESVLRVTDEVQMLNRSAFVEQQKEMAAIYRSTQQRLWGTFGLAVFVSLGIALLAAVYVGRLEAHLAQQRGREAENARDLQRLSTKLLTAQEEERRVISRELHDEVGQALTAIKVELAVAQRVIDEAGGPTDVLRDARAISDNVVQTVRDLSRLLHPSVLDDLGLEAAVEWYLKGFGKRHDLHVDLVQEGMSGRVGEQTEAAAFRIVQEALTNVAKHAHATSCRVYLQRLTNTLLVTVEDDGVGFDAATTDHAKSSGGLGLISVRERVTQLGGTLRLESAPGRGTRLTVELPALVQLPADLKTAPPVAKPALHEVLGG